MSRPYRPAPSSSQAILAALGKRRPAKASEMAWGAGEKGQSCPRCGRRVLLREGFDARHDHVTGAVTVTHTVCP